MFSSEYGWKTEDIWKLTMREVDWRLRAMLNRKNLEKSFTALLHDKEIKIPKLNQEDNKPIKVSKEQEVAMEQAIEQAIARKKMQYGS